MMMALYVSLFSSDLKNPNVVELIGIDHLKKHHNVGSFLLVRLWRHCNV